jgi:hypothetical protein
MTATTNTPARRLLAAPAPAPITTLLTGHTPATLQASSPRGTPHNHSHSHRHAGRRPLPRHLLRRQAISDPQGQHRGPASPSRKQSSGRPWRSRSARGQRTGRRAWAGAAPGPRSRVERDPCPARRERPRGRTASLAGPGRSQTQTWARPAQTADNHTNSTHRHYNCTHRHNNTGGRDAHTAAAFHSSHAGSTGALNTHACTHAATMRRSRDHNRRREGLMRASNTPEIGRKAAHPHPHPHPHPHAHRGGGAHCKRTAHPSPRTA